MNSTVTDALTVLGFRVIHQTFVPSGYQWQEKIHIALGLLAWWIIDKHRFTLYWVNQWQSMTSNNPLAPGLRAWWTYDQQVFSLPESPFKKRPSVKSYLVEDTDKNHLALVPSGNQSQTRIHIAPGLLVWWINNKQWPTSAELSGPVSTWSRVVFLPGNIRFASVSLAFGALGTKHIFCICRAWVWIRALT